MFRAVQPVTAMLIPPLAWIAFQITAVRALQRKRDAAHLIGPLLALFCAVHVPGALDLVIPGAFLGYGAAILLALRSGVDGMPRMRLETGDLAGRIWRVTAIMLLASAFIDGAIALAHMADLPHWQPWIVSVGSAGVLLMVGGLGLSQSFSDFVAGTASRMTKTPVQDVDTSADADIVARLNALLTDQKLYLDPDLTLGRMSRRLGVPVKQLSAAINRVTGSNVSRYVNGLRIEKACESLLAGETVTTAMLSSGFNTRSSFNREFRRVTGKSPSDWRGTQHRRSSMRNPR